MEEVYEWTDGKRTWHGIRGGGVDSGLQESSVAAHIIYTRMLEQKDGHWAAWLLEGNKIMAFFAAAGETEASGVANGMKQAAGESAVVQWGTVKLLPKGTVGGKEE